MKWWGWHERPAVGLLDRQTCIIRFIWRKASLIDPPVFNLIFVDIIRPSKLNYCPRYFHQLSNVPSGFRQPPFVLLRLLQETVSLPLYFEAKAASEVSRYSSAQCRHAFIRLFTLYPADDPLSLNHRKDM